MGGGRREAAAAEAAAASKGSEAQRDKGEDICLVPSPFDFHRSGIADGARSVIPLRLLLMPKRLSGLTPSGST